MRYPISKLRVNEAYVWDLNKHIVRMSYDMMDKINACPDDIILIEGSKKTPAICKPLSPGDEDKIIRIDNLGRSNAQINIGDLVKVRKVIPSFAEEIVLVPLDLDNSINPSYLFEALDEIPIIKENRISVRYYDKYFDYIVDDLISKDPNSFVVKLTSKTKLNVVSVVMQQS